MSFQIECHMLWIIFYSRIRLSIPSVSINPWTVRARSTPFNGLQGLLFGVFFHFIVQIGTSNLRSFEWIMKNVHFCYHEEFLYTSKGPPLNVGFIRKSCMCLPCSVQIVRCCVRRKGTVSWTWPWTWDKVLPLLPSSSVRILTVNLCLQPPRMNGRRRIEPQGAPFQFPLPTYPDSHDGSVQIVQVQIWTIF